MIQIIPPVKATWALPVRSHCKSTNFCHVDIQGLKHFFRANYLNFNRFFFLLGFLDAMNLRRLDDEVTLLLLSKKEEKSRFC